MTISRKTYLNRLVQLGRALNSGQSFQDFRNRIGQIWGLRVGGNNNNVRELFMVVRSEVDKNGSFNTHHWVESLEDGRRLFWKEKPNCDWDTSPHHRRIA